MSTEAALDSRRILVQLLVKEGQMLRAAAANTLSFMGRVST